MRNQTLIRLQQLGGLVIRCPATMYSHRGVRGSAYRTGRCRQRWIGRKSCWQAMIGWSSVVTSTGQHWCGWSWFWCGDDPGFNRDWVWLATGGTSTRRGMNARALQAQHDLKRGPHAGGPPCLAQSLQRSNEYRKPISRDDNAMRNSSCFSNGCEYFISAALQHLCQLLAYPVQYPPNVDGE